MDYSRVLRGLGIVAEKMIARNGPEAYQKLERAIYHARELGIALVELSAEINKRNNVNVALQNVTKDDSGRGKMQIPKALPPADNNSAPIHFDQSKLWGEADSSDITKGNGASQDMSSFQSVNSENTEFGVVAPYPPTVNGPALSSHPSSTTSSSGNIESITKEADPIGFSKLSSETQSESDKMNLENNIKTMRERSVPATQISRMWGFGSLAMRMAAGVAVDNVIRTVRGDNSQKSISEDNAERLAEALCRMRGAALKLGQMLSLQDEGMLPPTLQKALDRVRQNADYMPKRQLESQLTNQLGENWREKFSEFSDIPIAAASIGQVHRAKLLDGTDVVLKIQYPGVAESIESDLNNLKRLVR